MVKNLGSQVSEIDEADLLAARKPRRSKPIEWYMQEPVLQPLEASEEQLSDLPWDVFYDKTVRVPSDPKKALRLLYYRDGGICQLCGLKVHLGIPKNHPGSANKDHVHPVGREDRKSRIRDTWGNLQLAHRQCNLERNDGPIERLSIKEYRQYLLSAVERFEAGLPPITRTMSLIDKVVLVSARFGEPLSSEEIRSFRHPSTDTVPGPLRALPKTWGVQWRIEHED